MKKIIIFIGLCLVLGVSFATILINENILKNGKTVLLPLAPVDPRSLMQGDYMVLRYAIERDLYNLPSLDHEAKPKIKKERSILAGDPLEDDFQDGYIAVVLDEKGVASPTHLLDEPPAALKENEAVLRYRIRNGHFKIATNAFFFQEGTGRAFERARFGEFRVGANGEPRLVALRDANYERIKEEITPPEEPSDVPQALMEEEPE